MTRFRVVPLFGLAFVATAALMLWTVILRSPYTHGNLYRTLPADYTRTPTDAIGEANLESLRSEMAELPPTGYLLRAEGRPAMNTTRLPAQDTRPARVDTSALGKALFTQKCTSCHTVGEGKRVGPDLKNITSQRPRDWLVGFITSPERMIAQGDPVATLLVKSYAMPMPNLDISKVQAEALLEYIEAKSTSAPGIVPVSAPAGPGSTPAEQNTAGKAQFEQKCASCHTIGGGKLVGPDLKGIGQQRPADWLIGFITAPDKMIASGDATAAQLVKEYGMPMPNLGVSKADAEAMLAYIQAQSDGSTGGAAPAGAAAAPSSLAPGDAAAGRALFTGERPLANGGPACISCHNVAGIGALAGGSWGLDLTQAQTKTGSAGLASIMKSPPFPGMKEAFAAHPITDAEIGNLVAFFAAIEAQQAGASTDLTFPAIGLVAFLILIGVAQFAWRNRIRGVRKPMVGGVNK